MGQEPNEKGMLLRQAGRWLTPAARRSSCTPVIRTSESFGLPTKFLQQLGELFAPAQAFEVRSSLQPGDALRPSETLGRGGLPEQLDGAGAVPLGQLPSRRSTWSNPFG